MIEFVGKPLARGGGVRVLGLAAGCLLLLTRCATSGPTAVSARSGVTSERSARDEIAGARGLMDDGQYREAIPRLRFALEKYPEGETAAESWYLLGKSYEAIDGIKDAVDAFDACLNLAPEGPFAQESKERIASLSAMYSERYPAPDTLDAKIVSLLDALEREPDNVTTGLALADALWTRGRYDDAARVYVELAKLDSKVRGDEELQTRVDFGKGGRYTVLTPEELDRRDSARQPIEITETNGFRAGRDLLSSTPRFYVVTGQAVNRADSVLYGVTVEATIYGFGGAVYDTGEASIGTLHPRESRAFSVRLSEFPDINQVESYRCVARFRQGGELRDDDDEHEDE